MKFRTILPLSAFAFIVFMTSCSVLHDRKKNNNEIPDRVSLTPDLDKLENTSLLIDGKREEIDGNTENAIETFKKLLQKDHKNSAGMYELATIYVTIKNYKPAIDLLKSAVKIDPDNEWYNLQLAKTYDDVNDFDKAIVVYQILLKLNPDNIEYYYNLANEYIIKGKFNDAINIYNNLEKKIGINEEISVQKKNLYLQMNKLDKAVNEIQKLIDKYPDEVRYYNFKAEIYLANKMVDKALEVYNKILQIAPDDPHVHLSLAECYRLKGDKEKSFQELETAFSNNKLGIDIEISIMLSYFTVTDSYPELKDQAYKLCEIIIKAHPNEAKAYAIYGDFLTRDKKYENAREQYHKVIAQDSSIYNVWEQLLYIDSELKDYKSLIAESNKTIELFPLQPVPYMLNGDALYRLKKYNDAIKAFKKGAEITVNNNDLLVQFYSYLGDAYNELKMYPASDSSYAKALEINPDDELVLNNYAYYLCLRSENMKKAEDMAAKAVGLKPDSPSYLDTYGWILYKTGKLDKAKDMLAKALEKGGADNDIILEHYGDILYKSGYTEKALEYWKKARLNGKGTELLDKKIADGKLYE